MADSPNSILHDLERVIAARRLERPTNSYVVQLLDDGVAKIAAKLGEELGELVAAANEAPATRAPHIVHEAADVLFHLLVLLGSTDVAWTDVEAELSRRFGIGGLVEKASRK